MLEKRVGFRRHTLGDTVLVMDHSSDACPACVHDGRTSLEDIKTERTEEEDSERSKPAWFHDEVALE